jgi:DNA-binding NarL/FixJ family response regulator
MKGEEQVLTILNITLLVLNLLGVVFLIVKSSSQKKSPSQQGYYQKILENQKILSREMTELKMAMEHHHTLIKQEYEQLQAERQAFTASVQTKAQSNNGQNLLLNDRYKEIFELQEQGLSAEQIAAKLEKGFGEVDFILQLAAQGQH